MTITMTLTLIMTLTRDILLSCGTALPCGIDSVTCYTRDLTCDDTIFCKKRRRN